MNLAIGSILDEYVISQVLGVGGFSIVYLAQHIPTQVHVVLKEYMPRKLAQRMPDDHILPREEQDGELFYQGRKLFLHEATVLATLKHPNIVNVTSFFSANDTVYMVMEHQPGVNLKEYIETHKRNISERFMLTVFPPLLNGLKEIHIHGLLHLDIKPGNIHLCPGGHPILLDFGAVHKRHLGRRHQLNQVISSGFSPVEQYQATGYMGPWSDIYAIGATMRCALEGVAPPPAIDRAENDTLKPLAILYKRKFSSQLLEAIDWAMEIDPLLRPQTVDELIHALQDLLPNPGERDKEGSRLLGTVAFKPTGKQP